MKKIFITILFAYSTSIFSQTTTHNISDIYGGEKEGVYYKDVDSLLNDYIGTWLYSIVNSDGTTTSLKIKFRKLVNQEYNSPVVGTYYEDVIIGTYQYVNHNEEKFNNLSTLYSDIPYWTYNLYGNRLIRNNNSPFCSDCLLNEKRLKLLYTETDRPGLLSSLIIRKSINADGIQILNVKIWQLNNLIINNDVQPINTTMNIPFGDFILIKQP